MTLYVIESLLDERGFDRIDRGSSVILLPIDRIESSEWFVERFVSRRSAVVAFGSGRLTGRPLAVALFSDWFAIAANATLDVSRPDGELMAAMVERIGRRALPLLLALGGDITAAEAITRGLADVLVAESADPLEWFRNWIAGRDLQAFAAAASLLRVRGGDALERAEFSRLFATGIPQRGLKRFLSKESPDFSEDFEVKTL